MIYVCVRDCQFRKKLRLKGSTLELLDKPTGNDKLMIEKCFVTIAEAEKAERAEKEAEVKARQKAEEAKDKAF